MTRRRHPRQDGSALLLVLGALTLAAALAVALLSAARLTVERARTAAETATARQVAEGLIHRLAATLSNDAARARLPVDGTRIRGDFLDTPVSFRIRDEQGKIDLNHAPPDMLAVRLLLAGAVPAAVPGIIDAWLDWLDPDDAHRLQGAEAEDYRAAGLPQRPRNGPMAVIEEFAQVRGMTPALFEALRDDLTVHGGAAVVDPWSASAANLVAAGGAAPADIEAFVQERRTHFHPPLPPTLAGGRFGQSDEIAYRVTAEAATRSGAMVAVSALIGLQRGTEPPFVFLDWR